MPLPSEHPRNPGLSVTLTCSLILILMTGNSHRGFTTSCYYHPWFVHGNRAWKKSNGLAQSLRARQGLRPHPPEPCWCVRNWTESRPGHGGCLVRVEAQPGFLTKTQAPHCLGHLPVHLPSACQERASERGYWVPRLCLSHRGPAPGRVPGEHR